MAEVIQGKTTLKPISLGYRAVGSGDEVEYTRLMGVLKGMTLAQDEADEQRIEAEFYDSPFDVLYQGKPVVMTFELANYNLSDLKALFGGSYDAGSASSKPEVYEGAASATTTEWEWKLDFNKGYKSLVIYKGQTVGTLKKDADGALNYSVKITALVYTDTDDVDHLYKIVGEVPTV